MKGSSEIQKVFYPDEKIIVAIEGYGLLSFCLEWREPLSTIRDDHICLINGG